MTLIPLTKSQMAFAASGECRRALLVEDEKHRLARARVWRAYDKKIAGISNNDIWVDGTPATVTRAIRIIKEKGF